MDSETLAGSTLTRAPVRGDGGSAKGGSQRETEVRVWIILRVLMCSLVIGQM